MANKESYGFMCLYDDSESVVKGKGLNIIPQPEEEPLWRQYARKFKDPLIVILIIVLLFSIITSLYEYCVLDKEYEVLLEPLGVLISILLSTGVGFVFEVNADREFNILNQVKDSRSVKVIRKRRTDGDEDIVETIEVKKSDVVVGDVVCLESGDEIPADGKVIDSCQLKVDESAFTGEPYTNKDVNDNDHESTYPSNYLLRGTTVIEGNAIMKVEYCGTDTEEGKGYARVKESAEVKTPLTIQLEKISKWISTFSVIVGLMVIIVRLLIYFFGVTDDSHDFSFTDDESIVRCVEYVLGSFMIAITLIVVAVPEGLPMSITVSLAMSMRKMLKENNLVRKLHACETMGAATVICTDKTGTLTKNKMTVTESLFSADVQMDLIAMGIAVNSTAEITELSDGTVQRIGNPTECALLEWIMSKGYDYRAIREREKIKERMPFSTMNKYMITSTNSGHVFMKGASEILIEKCEHVCSDITKDKIFDNLRRMESKAMRTIGFTVDGTFVGVVGITDPVRDDVKEALDTCINKAGVRVIIVTGDTPGTAGEVGKQIGLVKNTDSNCALSGSDMDALTDDELSERLKQRGDGSIKIISRARPEHKERLVRLLQSNGEVVAVTGDGTNDVPALSRAQVGLSMGDGTARAKESSDITIIDNSFSSINKAILWGRTLYVNIRRFIIFQTTINVCACLMVLFGAFTGSESPLKVVQMLWINLIMDTFAAMALSSLPADEKLLNERPRDPNSNIISKKLAGNIFFTGFSFFILLCAVWIYLPHKYFFTIFVMMQFWNIFNARYHNTNDCLITNTYLLFSDYSKVRSKISVNFMLIALTIVIGQLLIVSYGGVMFEIETPLNFKEWMYIILFTSPVLIVPDVVRFVRQLKVN